MPQIPGDRGLRTESPRDALRRIFTSLGFSFERIDRAEIYRLGSKLVWVDFSYEDRRKPGVFFHGTPRVIFEDYYKKFSDSFYLLLIEAFPTTVEVIVVPARQFYSIFKEKPTASDDNWKFRIYYVNGRFVLKTGVKGAEDHDISDGLHKFELLGLSPDQSRVVNDELHLSALPVAKDPQNILEQFNEWLKTGPAQAHLATVEKEKRDVRELLKNLQTMDKSVPEFDDLVLYGLLPNSPTKYARRVSTFPAFYNVKSFFKEYAYSEDDWHRVALALFKLVDQFSHSPNLLKSLIAEFTSDKKYSRRFQCGSITPILFCVNDSFPVVNNRVIHTYNDFATFLGWNDNLHQKLDNYPDNIERCRRLVDALGDSKLQDMGVFDLFCYWYDQFFKSVQTEQSFDFYEGVGDRSGVKKVDFVSFIHSLNLENARRFEPRSLRNPDTIKIRDIVSNCSKGIWVLPKFQRYFEWRRNEVRDFLASIFNDYYVGSLLLWEVGREPPLDYMQIAGLDLRKEEVNPSSLILDGQQRVTSICYAIIAPGFPLKGGSTPLYFYINFQNFFNGAQLDEIPEFEPAEIITVLSTRLSKEETFRRMLFPLYELARFPEWVEGLERFMAIECNADTGESKLWGPISRLGRVMESRLRHIWDGFEIPYVSLPTSMELYQVTDIFEKINTAGIQLSVFDLLIARLSKYDIELRKLWDGTIQRYPKVEAYSQYSDKMPVHILQAILLSYNKTSSCKREDVLDIYRKVFQETELEFSDVWFEMADYVNRAILRLESLRHDSGFGVKDARSVPFEPMIPILASLLREIERNANKMKCYDKLTTWYWSSVFSNAYSGAVDATLTADFKEMKAWFENDSKLPSTVEGARQSFVTLNLKEVKSKASAAYRGVLCLLALHGAKDFNTGQTLEDARNLDVDHVFPLKHYKGTRYVDSVLNVTWMSDETNRIIKGAMKPSEYLSRFIKHDTRAFSKVLSTHLIDQAALEYMAHDDIDKFIESREKSILTVIANLIGFHDPFSGPAEIMPAHIFQNEMAFYNSLNQCDGFIHWVDKYFSPVGLRLLYYAINKISVKDVKILVSSEKANADLRHFFQTFRNDLATYGINCQLRVLADRNVKNEIHDRYVIAKNVTFNVPSIDTAERGQISEIKRTAIVLPFDRWWSMGLDILTEWSEIVRDLGH